LEDPAPSLTLRWEAPVSIGRVEISFDTDFDHAMESVQWGHPHRAMPSCIKRYVIRDGRGAILAAREDNYQTRNVIRFSPPVVTDLLTIEQLESHGRLPGAIFGIQCYE
jgi:hypothetical protein